MKIRFREASFRLRISPSELASLEDGAPIGEAIVLPGGSWRVTVAVGDRASIAADGGHVRIHLGRTDVQELAGPSTEGVYFRTEGPSAIDWFVEKDFPCVHPRPPEVRESPEETFEAPPRFAERHGAGNTGSGCA